MANETENNQHMINKVISVIIKKKKFFLISLLSILIIFSGIVFYLYYQKNLNNQISEKYIQAGIHLSSKDKNKSKNIYKEIILSKNKFYSPLALNDIIENDLEQSDVEILKLFDLVESININKEQKNLIKLKKSLYLLKISKKKEANKLINEILDENSIWKDSALEISK
jgi:hypothetical protein